MVTFTTWKGVRVTPWMAYRLNQLDHDIYNAFGVRIGATSGIRTNQEQKDIWYQRYVTAGDARGRRVYDTRWWNGQMWYRISSAGTVAQPGTSNHEIQGNRAAVDLYDTGSDAGVTSRWSARGRWIRDNAWKYDMVASGDGFGEGWHFDINNINKTPPGTPAGGGSKPAPKPGEANPEEEDNVSNSGFYYTRDNTTIYLIVNNDESTYHEYSNGKGNGPMPSAYNNSIAAAYKTGNFAPITAGHADVIKRQNTAKPGQEMVILDWNDVEFAKFLAAIQTRNAAPSSAEISSAQAKG